MWGGSPRPPPLTLIFAAGGLLDGPTKYQQLEDSKAKSTSKAADKGVRPTPA